MILNFADEGKTLESLVADKGQINAVRCNRCHNVTAFEDHDIMYINSTDRIFIKYKIERGYIPCAWCGKLMYVAEREQTDKGMRMTKKHFSRFDKMHMKKGEPVAEHAENDDKEFL